MTDEERKALLEKLRKEKMAKEAKERAVKPAEQPSEEHGGVFPDVYGTYARKQAEGRPFLEVLKERLFEPYPAWKKKKP